MFFPNNSQSMKFCRNSSNSPEYERWIPPTTISHATVCAKRQGRAQAGGPLPERGWRGRIWVDMRMYEEEAGCMRALKAFYKLGRTSMAFNSTRRVETFWPCRTKLGLMIILPMEKNIHKEKPNDIYKLLTANWSEISALAFTNKKWKQRFADPETRRTSISNLSFDLWKESAMYD